MKARWLIRGLDYAANVHRLGLAVIFAVIGPRAAYAITRNLATLLYRLLPPLQWRSEGQCSAALERTGLASAQIRRIAAEAFVQRVLNNTDLLLAPRWLGPRTFRRFGGILPGDKLNLLLDAQQRRHPLIFVSAYCGPFDLLPLLLGYNGIRAAVIYRPHANPHFDAYRAGVRGRGGFELIPTEQVISRIPEILERGGAVSVLGDIYDEKRGIPVQFLGLPTRVSKLVGLLAGRYGAHIVVAGLRRVRGRFEFEFHLVDIIEGEKWMAEDGERIAAITQRYMTGLEQLVLANPEQYLWMHAAWGEETAQRLTREAEQLSQSNTCGARPSARAHGGSPPPPTASTVAGGADD